LPPLFDFTPTELAINTSINHVLIPEHARTKENWPPPIPASGAAGAGAGGEQL
jgi:hypothetical protein